MDEISEEMRGTSQRLASLEHDARQPRLPMKADGQAGTETRERTEGTATAVQAMHGDSCSANRVDPGPKTTLPSFGVKADPPTFPCRDGVLVDNGAAAPKSGLPPLEMRSPTAAGGLLPTGEASIATRTTYNPPPIRLFDRGDEFKGDKFKDPNSTRFVDSTFFWKNNLPVAPCHRRKIGCLVQAVLKVVSASARFWKRGARFFLVRLYVLERLVEICSVFFDWKKVRGILFPGVRYKQLDCCFSAAADSKILCCRGQLEAIGAEGTNGGHAVEGGSRI